MTFHPSSTWFQRVATASWCLKNIAYWTKVGLFPGPQLARKYSLLTEGTMKNVQSLFHSLIIRDAFHYLCSHVHKTRLCDNFFFTSGYQISIEKSSRAPRVYSFPLWHGRELIKYHSRWGENGKLPQFHLALLLSPLLLQYFWINFHSHLYLIKIIFLLH